LCCVISAWYELGIEPEFKVGCTLNDEAAHLIKFPGA
ncbi:MAG: hypothetical protein JWO38_8251, partial [Gemmataceae bacterium]|nr:hypothetical protein [Gemmataceae bacterium]